MVSKQTTGGQLPRFLHNYEHYLESDYIVIDIETTNHGPDNDPRPMYDNWFLYGYAKYSNGHKIELNHISDYIELAGECLNGNKIFVAHNAKFELQYLIREGFPVQDLLVWDTQVAERKFLSNRQGRLDLDSVALKYGGTGKNKYIDLLMKDGLCPSEMPRSMLQERCQQDVENTEKIYLKQLTNAKNCDTLRVIHTGNLAVPVIADTEMNGMYLDKELVYRMYQQENEKYHEIIDQLNAISSINYSSPQQVAELLYKELKFDIPKKYGKPLVGKPSKKFPEGTPKTDEDTIALLKPKTKKQHKFIELKQQESKLRTKLNRYYSLYLDSIENNNSHVYGNINQTIAHTQRLSSSKPNLQNQDRSLKKAFTARYKKWSIRQDDYCIAPYMRVLTEDFLWKEAASIEKGDTLIGFEETPSNNRRTAKFQPAIVQAVKQVEKPTYRLSLDNGTVVECSTDHTWLSRPKSDFGNYGNYQWKVTEEINPEVDALIYAVPTWEDCSNTPDAAWLAGFLDGEGNLHNGSGVAFGQKAEGDNLLVLDKANKIILDYCEKTACSINQNSNVHRVMPTGHRAAWKVLGSVRPVRLLKKLKEKYHEITIRSKYNKHVHINKIEYLGKQKLIAIQTDQKTYITEGLLSHNCQLEYRVAGFMGQCPVALEDINNGVDVHELSTQTIFDITPEHKEYKEYRNHAKPHTFKPLYGGKSGTDKEKEYYKKFMDKHTGIREWHDSLLDEAWKTKQLVMPTGLIFYFPNCGWNNNGYFVNQTNIKNYPVQYFATGEIALIGYILMWHYMKIYKTLSFIVNEVHDAIISEQHPKEEKIMNKIAQIAMIDGVKEYLYKVYNIDFNFPLEAETEINTNWGYNK